MASVTRIGDADLTHCSPMVRAQGSPNVFVNRRAVSRQGDLNSGHLKPAGDKCVGHVAPISKGSSSVFVNGKGIGRINDAISGCTKVAAGSSNVFAGN